MATESAASSGVPELICELGECRVQRDLSCCLVCAQSNCWAACKARLRGDRTCIWQEAA